MINIKTKRIYSDFDEEVAWDGKEVDLLGENIEEVDLLGENIEEMDLPGENIEEMSLHNIGIPAQPIDSGKPRNPGHSLTIHTIKLKGV